MGDKVIMVGESLGVVGDNGCWDSKESKSEHGIVADGDSKRWQTMGCSEISFSP